MQHYSDNFIPIILMEDDLLHTNNHPFCSVDSCMCHEAPELLTTVGQAVTDGLFTSNEATNFIQGKTF